MPCHIRRFGTSGISYHRHFLKTLKLPNYRTGLRPVTSSCHVTSVNRYFGDFFSSTLFQNSRTADYRTIASLHFGTSTISSPCNLQRISPNNEPSNHLGNPMVLLFPNDLWLRVIPRLRSFVLRLLSQQNLKNSLK